MSARPSYRLFQASRTFFRQPLRRRINTAAQPEAPTQGGFAKVWNSPVGPKTVHFWYDIDFYDFSDFCDVAPEDI
jgi:hypothetical protein